MKSATACIFIDQKWVKRVALCASLCDKLNIKPMISNSMYNLGCIFLPPLKKNINDYTLQSFQSSHFPLWLQRASVRLEWHRSSAAWKFVQLIQQHADLRLSLPSRCAPPFTSLYLRWEEMNHGEKGAILLSTSHPMLLHKDVLTLRHNTAVNEVLGSFTASTRASNFPNVTPYLCSREEKWLLVKIHWFRVSNFVWIMDL